VSLSVQRNRLIRVGGIGGVSEYVCSRKPFEIGWVAGGLTAIEGAAVGGADISVGVVVAWGLLLPVCCGLWADVAIGRLVQSLNIRVN